MNLELNDFSKIQNWKEFICKTSKFPMTSLRKKMIDYLLQQGEFSGFLEF
jgi:hypothetical protein